MQEPLLPSLRAMYNSDVGSTIQIILCVAFVAMLVRLYFRAKYLRTLPPQPFDPLRRGMIEGVPVIGDSGGASGDFGSDHHSLGDHGGDGAGHGH